MVCHPVTELVKLLERPRLILIGESQRAMSPVLWIIIWSLRRYWCYLNSPGPRSKGRLCPGVFALFAETPATRYTMYISMMAIDHHQPCYNAHNQGQDAPEALWGQVSRRTRRWSGGEGSGRHRVRPWFTAPWWSLTTTPRPTIMVTKTKTKT